MNTTHDELLDYAIHDSFSAKSSPSQRNQVWRGTNGLGAEGCVVPIEYARQALLEQDEPRQTRLLEYQAALEAGPTDMPALQMVLQMARALYSLAAAAIHYRGHDYANCATQIGKAAKTYEDYWRISTQFVGKSTDNSPGIAGRAFAADLFSNDDAAGAMRAAEQSGRFGEQGVSVSSWLTIYCTLRHLFAQGDPFQEAPGSTLKMLLADTGQETGHVAPVSIQCAAFRGTPFPGDGAVFLDARAWGITVPTPTSVDEQGKKHHGGAKLRDSLWLAWRCCRQSIGFVHDQTVALRIQIALPPQYSELQGASAGGLFAVGMYAAAQRERPVLLDPSGTTTCRLDIPVKTRDQHLPRVLDESQDLRPQDVQVARVGSVPTKLDTAWLRKHELDTFLLHPDDAGLWRKKRGTGKYPEIKEVKTLQDLLEGFLLKQAEEQELERVAIHVHGAWKRAEEAVRDNDGLNPDSQHRLDCYVPPSFRVEGIDRTAAMVLGSDNGPDTNIQREYSDAVPATPVEAPVPNAFDDDDLLHLLALSIRGQCWPDQPEWIRPRRHLRHLVIYDNAGAGKTVCTLRLRHLLTDPNHRPRIFGHRYPPLVVHLDGRWLREHDTVGRLLSVRELLEADFARQSGRTRETDRQLVKDVVDHALRHERAVIIPDGLDQFPDEDRKHLAEVFRRTEDAKHCKWIVASRVHAIEECRRDGLFQEESWLRVRIEPFSTDQQDRYFNGPNAQGVAIGPRWSDMVDRKGMAELLQLPVVLSMLRILIETSRPGDPLPVFESLSQLYLITSRKMLTLALEKNLKTVHGKLNDEEWLAFENLGYGSQQKEAAQLELLEHVLSLFAFQMMLLQNYNARVVGNRDVKQFHAWCEKRYFLESDQQDTAHLSRREQLKRDKDLKDQQSLWEIGVKILHTIETSHRGLTEALGQAVLALRSRKVMECMAARYLTRYATEYDVFGDAPDRCWALDSVSPEVVPKLAAVDFVTDPEWKDVWELAINMPQAPLQGTSDVIYQDAVISHEATCRSLSVLFRQPKAYPGREVRPTQLMYLAWHLFEYDEQLLRERRFRMDGSWLKGVGVVEKHGADTLERLGRELLLGERNRIGGRPLQHVVEQRKEVLQQFRATSRPLVEEFERRWDTILVDGATGRREPLSADDGVRAEQLARWQQQSSFEKSHTFLQCPPKEWLAAFEAGRLAQDPRINPAIKGHKTERFPPLFVQATTVTRGQYRQFDPAFEAWEQVADRLQDYASAFGVYSNDDDFPIIRIDWFDAWVFCKWLGAGYRLPTEWEWAHVARAGARTTYYFGDGPNGSQVSRNDNFPHGVDVQRIKAGKRPFLRHTTPVGCVTDLCSPWGLWDVHGNVWEWCSNWYDEEESSRSLRGGAWFYSAQSSVVPQTASIFNPLNRHGLVGFRLCR